MLECGLAEAAYKEICLYHLFKRIAGIALLVIESRVQSPAALYFFITS